MSLVPGLEINDFGVDDTNGGKRKCWLCLESCNVNTEWARGTSCVCALFVCPYSSHHWIHLSKIVKSDSHKNETRMAITAWFERRIVELGSDAEKLEIQALCFSYLRTNRGSGAALKIALKRLVWFKQRDRVAALMLAIWKNVARSRASEQPVGIEVKDLRTAMDLCDCHRNDWKLYKRDVYDAGQVHLVEKLVRPFSEESSSFQW
jgi:hypothetical protein